MKINKDTGISIGALAIILPLAFWLWGAKADKKDAEKTEKKVVYEREINIRQTAILESLRRDVDEQEENLEKEIDRLYERIAK